MATIQSLPTTFLELALVTNPGVDSFPWNLNGNFNGVTSRSQIINELLNRQAAIPAAQPFNNAIYDFKVPIGAHADSGTFAINPVTSLANVA